MQYKKTYLCINLTGMNKSMYKLSVIMPCFNNGKYLKNTLNSVINQTIGFENIELILVDDGSTDNSRVILKEYSKNYSNIKTIFLDENSGFPGIPRNIGIKNATSDYIMFIDADDEYFPEICDKLYNTIVLENADVVGCDWLETDDCNTVSTSFSPDEVVFGDEIVYIGPCAVWMCIFKKSIILDNSIYFPSLKVCEDNVFILNYFLYSKKLVYLKGFCGYHYIRRNNSISATSLDNIINSINVYELMFNILEEHGGNYDSNRFFKRMIPLPITQAIILDNKCGIKEILSSLYDFEKKINFIGKLPIIFQVINFFILRGNLSTATYICLFISKLRKSNLFLKIHRKFFLKKV